MVSLTEGITPEHLALVYLDPYMARIGYDSRPHEPVFHPLASYLSAWVDGQFAGAFLVIRFTEYEYELHSLLGKHALKHSRQLGRLFVDWSFAHADVLRVTAYVIEGLESAKNFCLRLGFAYEGFRRHSVLVNGERKGMHILGMTREDWSAL